MRFNAEGNWEATNERCRKRDFGQLDSSSAIFAPAQKARPLDGEAPLDFEALLYIDRESIGSGF